MSKDIVQEGAHMPRDKDSATMQVLSPGVNECVAIAAVQGSSAAIALPSDTGIVRVAASGNCYIAFGGSGISVAQGEADAMVFPGGVEFFHMKDSTYTYIAARSIDDETIQVTATRME